MHTKEEKMEAFGRLLDIMDDLREKCPWDREQTRESLRTNTIEETFELSEAILKDHPEEIKKELGDLLLHIVFYAKIGQEKGEYDIKDVCDALCEKLIYRHPHVYGTTDVQGSTHRVEQNWEQLKLKEKDGNRTVLDGVPTSLPALIKAYRMQDKARNVGFDWERREQVWDKVGEELGELRAELLDGQGRPVTLLGPGPALLKALEALVGRARSLQRLHQGGALRGALGELLRALLQLAGGALQLLLPLL